MSLGSNRSFGGGSSRPSSFGRPAPASPAPIHKGFGSVPTARRVQSFVPPAQSTRAEHASTGEGLEKAPVVSPVAYGIFLLGPGASALRLIVEEFAPHLDEASGDYMHWILLGHPRRSNTHFRIFLESKGVSIDELEREWEREGADRADEADVIANETAKLARLFQVEVADLPAVMFVFPNQDVSTAMKLRLIPSTATSPQLARVAVSLLCTHFSEKSLIGPSGVVGRELDRRLALGIQRQITAFLLAISDLPGAQKSGTNKDAAKAYVLAAVRDGRRLTEAASEAGISPQAVYKDEHYGPLVKSANDRRSGARGSVRRGRKQDGLVETSDTAEELDNAQEHLHLEGDPEHPGTSFEEADEQTDDPSGS